MILGFDSQSFKGWECQKGEKRWSTNACPYSYRIFSLPFFFLLLRFLLFGSLIISFFLYSPLHVFFLLYMATSPPLYCLISWDFSLLSLRLHQPFLASCGHLSRITHQPIGCLATTSTQSVLVAPLFIPGQNSLFGFFPPPPPPSFSALPKWIRIGGSLPTYPYGMHQVAPALLLPLFW